MTDTLFNIEPTTPKWVELADGHKIYRHNSASVEPNVGWSAWYFGVLEKDYAKDWKDRDPLDMTAEYCSLIEDRGGVEYADNEREAVVALIHRLKLEGWNTISL